MDRINNYYDRFSRTAILIGKDNLDKLKSSTVLIAGLGGVGSFVYEAAVRAGIGTVHIIDFDTVEISNCNRQLVALESTLGMPKVDVAERRAKDINPDVVIIKHHMRITPHNAADALPQTINFAVDAIDDVDAKTALIAALYSRSIPFISCMGAARAFNPESLRIQDISKTQYCPLARSMRKRLRDNGIAKGVRCIYFHEERNSGTSLSASRIVPGSLSYMPGIMGLAAAGCAVTYITENEP